MERDLSVTVCACGECDGCAVIAMMWMPACVRARMSVFKDAALISCKGGFIYVIVGIECFIMLVLSNNFV